MDNLINETKPIFGDKIQTFIIRTLNIEEKKFSKENKIKEAIKDNKEMLGVFKKYQSVKKQIKEYKEKQFKEKRNYSYEIETLSNKRDDIKGIILRYVLGEAKNTLERQIKDGTIAQKYIDNFVDNNLHLKTY